jgi:outer membrane protein TolC
MLRFPPLAVLGFAVCCHGLAQSPPAEPVLKLTLAEALERARQQSPQILAANITALLARQDVVLARSALLPNATVFNQFIYTQPTGLPSGVFVSNDGPHVYNSQIQVHGEIYNPVKLADYHRVQFAEALARARADIAARGLLATVVQNYYGMVVAARKVANAEQSQREAEQFLDITEKQERGGEVAHSDTVKAQLQAVQRRRDTQEARLNADKARIGFAVLLFPNFRQDFTVVDDLDSGRPLPPFDEISSMAARNSPDLRAAQAAVQQQTFELRSAQAARLPSFSFDYFYGMNSNYVAWHNPQGFQNIGSVAQAQMTLPVWTWGAAKARIAQADLHLQQARNDLTFTQRQLLANLNAFYLEAAAAGSQIASLRQSLELAGESLKLTLLRYQAGEATALEVADAQTTLLQARNAYDDGMVRYRLGIANLQTLTGAF